MIAKRWPVAGGVLLVAAVGGLLWWSPWEPREPVYDGKPLSYHLAFPGPGVATIDSTTGTEIRTLDDDLANRIAGDTNAVPFLTMALSRDAWFGQKAYRVWLWPKLPATIRTHLPPPTNNGNSRINAAVLLSKMGTAARPAVPALARALTQDEELEVRLYALYVLYKQGGRDKAVLAALAEAARKDKNALMRQTAGFVLAQIDTEAAAKAGVKKPSP
jgi:hypothetical protein